MSLRRALAVSTAALATGLLLTGCAAGDADPAADDGGLTLVAAFYPLAYVSERVGGPHVQVTNLTKAGAEPHDLELAPRDVGRLAEADLVVYLPGFQPSVEDAVRSEAADVAFDVTASARLDLQAVPLEDAVAQDGHADGHDHSHGHEDGDHASGDSGDHDGHDHGSADPHFWLDPTRLADVADAVADRLADLDAANSADYRDNAAALRAELETLDTELRDGLATCATRELVTSHTAFGYLADRYDLHQVGITGLTPESDPSARDLARIAQFVKDHQVTTVYHEVLVSPAVANAVAEAAGVSTAVLDPVEGLSDASAGNDYREVMLANLATLRTGQSCS